MKGRKRSDEDDNLGQKIQPLLINSLSITRYSGRHTRLISYYRNVAKAKLKFTILKSLFINPISAK